MTLKIVWLKFAMVLLEQSISWYLSCIMVMQISEGEVEAYSSCSVELVFAPEVAASHSGEFLLTFSHPSLKPVRTHTTSL